MHSFKSEIAIIGINPYVTVPSDILSAIFVQASKDKGSIPVHGYINQSPYTQTLVRYANEWRLYINMTMLKDSPKHIGEVVEISIEFDPRDRSVPMHPELQKALQKDKNAQRVFDSLTPSLQKEINRYLFKLKTDEKILENVRRAVDFLNGKGRFVGREL